MYDSDAIFMYVCAHMLRFVIYAVKFFYILSLSEINKNSLFSSLLFKENLNPATEPAFSSLSSTGFYDGACFTRMGFIMEFKEH